VLRYVAYGLWYEVCCVCYVVWYVTVAEVNGVWAAVCGVLCGYVI
jgi:hypothetical protein